MKSAIEEFHRSKHDLADVKALLAMAVGRPTIEKLAYLVDVFYASDGRTMFVALNNRNIIGIIGIDYINRPYGFIAHIAVLPGMRRKGIASKLIKHATVALKLTDIGAETDQDGIGFYNACYFETKEIESPYRGVRRFSCIRSLTELTRIR